MSLVQNGTAGTLQLYLNGVQVASGTAQQCNGNGQLLIGGDPRGHILMG